MYVVVRTGDPVSAGEPLRDVVRRVAPGVPVFDVRTMEERLGASLSTARFNMLLLTLLGAIGLLLAAIGIYGVIGYFVSPPRGHERRRGPRTRSSSRGLPPSSG